MTAVLGLGVLVMILADAVVGTRLVLLSLRTRRLPEFALGSAVLLLGGVGYPLSIAARQGVGGPEGAPLLLGTAVAIQNLAALAMAIATWQTFRPGARWAGAACAACATALLAGWIGQALTVGFPMTAGAGPYYWLGLAARALPFVWTAHESWRYFGKLRRRLALGLAEPIVTDRFRLWALSASATTAAFAVFAVAAWRGIDVSGSAWVLLCTSAAGCLSGVTFWLAFLPPKRYLDRFTAGAAA